MIISYANSTIMSKLSFNSNKKIILTKEQLFPHLSESLEESKATLNNNLNY